MKPFEIAQKYVYGEHDALTDNQEIIDMTKDIEQAIAEQLILSGVTFCLPIEGDTFESWHHRNFTMNTDGSIVAIKNETIKYTQTQMLELWDFLTDRLLAN